MNLLNTLGQLLIVIFSINTFLWVYTQKYAFSSHIYKENIFVFIAFIFMIFVGVLLVKKSKDTKE